MKWIERILDARRLILTLALMLAAAGAVSWATMVRQEDPRLPDFWGQVVTAYPGADAETIELNVLEPIEDALAEVDEIKTVTATAFDEVTVIEVELRGDTADFDEAWDDVREALEKARQDFPAGVGAPVLNRDLMDQDSVVLAVTGSPDLNALLDGARELEDALLALPMVSRVDLIADPGEQVTIALDDAVARRLGITDRQLAEQLSARNRIRPGGSLRLAGKTIRLRPLSEFSSVAEIAATPVVLASGAAVPLSELARVHLGPREPERARMRRNGEMAVGVAVVPRKAVNLVAFGRSVRETVDRVSAALDPLRIAEVTFQPDRTAARLSGLSRSLLFGILVVGGVLVLSMGVRLGLVVASVVPLVAFSALAVFAWGGGILHQISIAALVLALGMLVDNAIVMAETIQWRLDRGEPPREAIPAAIRELALPLAGATATTLAAFVPMLVSEGPTAAFTRTIPVVVMLTLTVSYLFAVFVTPLISGMVLKPRPSGTSGLGEVIGRPLAGLATRRPVWVLLTALLLVAGSLTAAGSLKRQFFPTSDRNQLLVDIKLPEGAHLDATDAAARRLEQSLLDQDGVTAVASFMGRSAPQFYYNVQRVPFSLHFAQLIVETRGTADLEPVIGHIRQVAGHLLPETEIVARKLEQGPPVNAPVEIRLFGSDFEKLYQAASAITRELDPIPGTVDVRHDLGPGAPTVRFRVDDAAAGRYGLTRADVALALLGRTRGLEVGELFGSEDPIPVLIRSPEGERMRVEDMDGVTVTGVDGRSAPLGQVVHMETAWRPAAIQHRDRRRVVTVSAQLEGGITFNQVLADLEQRLAGMDLPDGIQVRYGGDAEGSGEANSALMRSFPIGLMLLLGVLLAEFNSFRKLGIILVTIPLSASGVVPGLLMSGQPFGFMSLLGVIALVGIVVNNAIVLLEVIDSRIRRGATVDTALSDAVARRIRPILLTTATTVVGLLPLAFSDSTLWPPLAFAMISGLLASTLLTLVVVPSLYRLLLGRDSRRKGARGKRFMAPATGS